ncbi:DinB family protein [Actinopolymorpha pittospori]|uniref:Damage-inducible protein DinB n=1 Tax=Actinopolymorpha pittospori TaxID=648752 RepID=A0A927RD94_9ACTN|nr:DinB family protein [Actinopolymorpha pittospori]MBE1607905.1 putative damage-inducible protein DinB [Actinopolymorpha pittospori]
MPWTLVDQEAHGDEAGALLGFLDAQRRAIRRTLHGLTDEQAGTKPSASELSLAGLLKHVAEVEQGWVEDAKGVPHSIHRDTTNWHLSFELEGEQTVAWVHDFWDDVAAETEKFIRSLPDLDGTFPLPPAPWFPPQSVRSVRFMLLTLIQEMARHAGHADVIRESLDGATAYDLMARTNAG